MNEFIKAYVSDILWALAVTLFEIALLAGCLFVLTLLPHGLAWFNLGYFQCVVIIAAYRLITYKMNKSPVAPAQSPPNESGGYPPSFNTVYPDDPEPNTRPMRNVYSAEETEELNHESEFSVRE